MKVFDSFQKKKLAHLFPCQEMYADVDARGGILEPPGIVEVKYRAHQQASITTVALDRWRQSDTEGWEWTQNKNKNFNDHTRHIRCDVHLSMKNMCVETGDHESLLSQHLKQITHQNLGGSYASHWWEVDEVGCTLWICCGRREADDWEGNQGL